MHSAGWRDGRDPGVFVEGAVDIAGTIVGAVDRRKLLPRPGVAPGQILVGMASSGLHTNGYSLARQVVGGQALSTPLPGGSGESIGDALCAVHRSYLPVLKEALRDDSVLALAHITGGGLIDNLPRVLPDDVGAVIDTTAWPRPPLFSWLIEHAALDLVEAHRIFNCGVGMVAVVAPERLDDFVAAVPEPTWIIGETTAHAGGERTALE